MEHFKEGSLDTANGTFSLSFSFYLLTGKIKSVLVIIVIYTLSCEILKKILNSGTDPSVYFNTNKQVSD